MGSVDKNSILVVDDQAGIRILLEELFICHSIFARIVQVN